RAVILVINVAFRSGEDHDLAARAYEAGFAFLRASRRVTDLRFQPVGEIVRLVLVQRRNLERDFQATLRVQPPFALFHHVFAVTVLAILIAFALLVLASDHAVFVFVAEPPVEITRAVDVILHIAIGHRRAGEVLRLDCEPGLFAYGHEIFRRRDFDLEFGLLVFGHFKRAARTLSADRRDDRIEPERHARGQIDLAAERPAR